MSWKEEYISALDHAGLFENSGHRTRFKELLDCYGGFPFFTRGLCKCIYLSAWDEEHFTVMLETLTEMSLGRETGTGEMTARGDSLALENTGAEACMYQLSCAMLENRPYEFPEDVPLPEEYRYIIRRAMEAAEVIDSTNIDPGA